MKDVIIPSGEQQVRWHPVADTRGMQRIARERILVAAADAIAARGSFRIVLSGGSTPRSTFLSLRDADTDWSRWQIFFGDERCLSIDDPERNSRMARDAWLDHVALPREHIHAIPAELGADAAARAYADTLREIGDFDLVILGLGEDGHTASLFPDHDWGTAADAPDTLAVHDAPKPPPQRVTLTAARLARARAVLFLVEGESKHAAIARWRAGGNIPAREIRPATGVDVLVEAGLLAPLTHRAHTPTQQWADRGDSDELG
ncbi:MAG: 6-phosphogluconolactonase [Dokdonella sp.]